MPLSRDAQLVFWQTIARDFSRGEPLIPSLEHAQRELAGTDLDRITEEVIRDIREGSSLHGAMAQRSAAFSQCECAMTRAGEAGGTLDVATRRIVESIQDGSFPLPGTDGRTDDQPAHYWRAFGRLLASGVATLEALRLIAVEVAGPQLAEATHGMRQAILDGRDLAAAMRGHHRVFPEEVCRAVDAAEQNGDLAQQALRIADAIEAESLTSLTAGPEQARTEADEETNAAVAFVAQMIRAGVEQRASDIHLDATEDGRGRLRLRVDGLLCDLEPPPEGLFPQVVRQVKINCHLDTTEERLPQEGRISLNLGGRPFDLRVGVIRTVCGERVVMRILDRGSARLDLERIEFLDDDLATVRELCQLPNGLIICNGPTGSGKTTLLYAMLNEMDRDRRSVVTVEDPVEYNIDGAAQIQVESKKGLTCAQAIQSVLRQDPDVLMVGSIRDLEIASLCVQTAITGHLVLTTLDATSSPEAVKRLLDIGLEPFLVNGSLSAVISQRLVRVLCPECKREAEPPLHSLPPEAVELVQRAAGAAFHAPQGCGACNGTGYRGRTAIHEILIPNDRVRHAIAAAADVESVRNAALAAGMRPMLACGIQRAARGVTSLQEVCRVTLHGTDD